MRRNQFNGILLGSFFKQLGFIYGFIGSIIVFLLYKSMALKFLLSLIWVAFIFFSFVNKGKNGMLSEAEKGKILYKQHCMSCHSAGREKLTAIGLRDAWDEIPKPKEKWFVEYVQNPDLKHQTKDAHILKIEERLKKEGKQRMLPIALSKEEIKSIISYVKTQK